MIADVHTTRERNLTYASYACIALGFFIPLIASKFIGMGLGTMPAVSTCTIVLWTIGTVLNYFAFMSSKKGPVTAPFWIKLSGFVSADAPILLTLAILFGYLFYPSIEKSFIANAAAYLLMISLFIMGLAIDFQDWKRILKNPKVIGIAVAMRWLTMPFGAFAVAYLIFIQFLPASIAGSLAIGLILLGVAPTGTTSNVFTMVARGDLALSVSVTALNTFLAPFLLPILTLWLAGSMASVNAGAMFRDLLRMVIVPVTLGTILGSTFRARLDRIKPVLGPIAVICLCLIVMGSMSRGTNTMLSHLYVLFYLAVASVLYAVLAYLVGFFLPKWFGFNVKQRKAACFEIAVTNAALAMTLASRHFGPLATLVCIFYAKINIIVGSTIFIPLLQKMKDDDVVAAEEDLTVRTVPLPPRG